MIDGGTLILNQSVEDWTNWADGKIDPIIVDFILNNKEHLEHKGELEPHKVYPSRRSWAHFAKCLGMSDDNLLEPNDEGKISMDLYFIGEGYIGQEAAIAFRDFVEKLDAQVTVSDILNGRRADIIKNFGINDANLMLDKLAASDEFKAPLDEKQLQNIANFVGNISPELAMKGWEALTRANGDAIAKMWSVELEDGKTFGNYIKEIVGQPKKD